MAHEPDIPRAAEVGYRITRLEIGRWLYIGKEGEKPDVTEECENLLKELNMYRTVKPEKTRMTCARAIKIGRMVASIEHLHKRLTKRPEENSYLLDHYLRFAEETRQYARRHLQPGDLPPYIERILDPAKDREIMPGDKDAIKTKNVS